VAGVAPAHAPHDAAVALDALDAHGDASSRRASSARKLPGAGGGTGGYASARSTGRSVGGTAPCSIHSSNAARGIRSREHSRAGAQLAALDRAVDRARRQAGELGRFGDAQQRGVGRSGRIGRIGPHTSKEARTPIGPLGFVAADRRRRAQRRKHVPVWYLSTSGRGFGTRQNPCKSRKPSSGLEPETPSLPSGARGAPDAATRPANGSSVAPSGVRRRQAKQAVLRPFGHRSVTRSWASGSFCPCSMSRSSGAAIRTTNEKDRGCTPGLSVSC
jgi:hypothetical protein